MYMYLLYVYRCAYTGIPVSVVITKRLSSLSGAPSISSVFLFTKEMLWGVQVVNFTRVVPRARAYYTLHTLYTYYRATMYKYIVLLRYNMYLYMYDVYSYDVQGTLYMF